MAQHGTSALKAKVRSKVKRKFPGIAMKMHGGAVRSRADRAPRTAAGR